MEDASTRRDNGTNRLAAEETRESESGCGSLGSQETMRSRQASYAAGSSGEAPQPQVKAQGQPLSPKDFFERRDTFGRRDASSSSPCRKRTDSSSYQRAGYTDVDSPKLRHSTTSVSSNNSQKEFCSFSSMAFISEHHDDDICRRYEIDKQELGAGGYGKVYVAKDRMFADRLVAIKKVLKLNYDHDAKFHREVSIMKDLDHPSICRLFETYEDDRFMQFVIEYLEGGDLFDRYMDNGAFEEPMVASVMKQVASALRYAHRKGIAHRDMKLENICFCDRDATANPHVKVIDWGLGKHFVDGRMSSNVGSSMYSAPEVIECDPADEISDVDPGYTSACDIWSLGVVTYVTLSGKPPFYGSPMAQLRNMKAEVYPFTKGIWLTTSDDAKDFIRSLLKADPKDRLNLDEIVRHPWLQRPETVGDMTEQMMIKSMEFSRVLSNLEQFSHAPSFFSICCASVARQLDCRSLRHIHEIFCEVDKNGDGFITHVEFQDAVRDVFGEESQEYMDSFDTFQRLDLDNSGVITYTEFCAGALGENMFSQEHVMWAAFKSFDLTDNGQVSKQELQQVLARGDVNEVWTPVVCEAVARDVIEEFSPNHKADYITFEDWLKMMREYSMRHRYESPRRISKTEHSMELDLFKIDALRNSSKESANLSTYPESEETYDTRGRGASGSYDLSSRDNSSCKDSRMEQTSWDKSHEKATPPIEIANRADPLVALASVDTPARQGGHRALLQRLACCFPFA
jgi:calcium-dependent protein kinase